MKRGREAPGEPRGTHQAITPCDGAAATQAVPRPGVRPPGSSLALSSAISLSHPKKHLTIAQTHVLAVLARNFDLLAQPIFSADSCACSLVYRMLFSDGDEREVPPSQPCLLSICRNSWSRSK
jgi:hypothetical protein